LQGIDYGLVDKKQYDDAVKLIDQYYNQLLADASQSAKDINEFNQISKDLEIQKYDELISAAQKFGQDASVLIAARTQAQLSEQDRKFNELKKIFDEFLNTPAGRYFFGAGQPVQTPPPDTTELEKSIENIKEQIIGVLSAGATDALFSRIQQDFELQAEQVEELKNIRLDAIEEEEQALTESFDRRELSKRQLEASQKQLALERIEAEKKAEQQMNAIKRKQDIANRVRALFDIALQTAVNVTKVATTPALIPYVIGLGAAQAAAVLAQPLPKYKKGTLSVKGVGTEDTELALLQPGEAVIPTETNKKYHPAIKAIYENKVRPEVLNSFVNLQLKGGLTEKKSASGSAVDLYALARIIRKNDGVTIKNIGDLARILSSDNYNYRRS
jgi:hypothetical protein